STSARNAKLAEARKAQHASERRRTVLLVGAAGLVIAFILGAVGWSIWSERGEREAAGGRSGVGTYAPEGLQHTHGPVDCSGAPPSPSAGRSPPTPSASSTPTGPSTTARRRPPAASTPRSA